MSAMNAIIIDLACGLEEARAKATGKRKEEIETFISKYGGHCDDECMSAVMYSGEDEAPTLYEFIKNIRGISFGKSYIRDVAKSVEEVC